MADGMRPLQPYSLRAFANFRARLEELGAELLEPEWLGASVKHRLRCPKGHLILVKPATVQQGRGFCIVCSGKDPREAERAFLARMAELGVTVLGRYVNSQTKVLVICAGGHEVYALPASARRGGICKKCARNDPEDCEARFLARLAELGAKPLYMTWEGAGKGHDVLCAAGHLTTARPSGVLSGEGACSICAGNSPEAAGAAFRARLAELGATLLEPGWLGSGEPHHVVDAAGHHVYPRPGNVRAGWGICKFCAGKDPGVGEAKFRAKLAELECTPLYETYLGRNEPHHCRCAAGHDCYPIPSGLQRGQGPCRVCAKHDPVAAEAAFRARIAELGGVVLGEYQRAGDPVHCRCPVGHDCYPRPGTLQQGHGMCWACSGRCPDVAEAKFLARLRDLGATPAYGEWGSTARPHHCICAAGHDCYPWPANVISGSGICLICAGRDHTAFYVVEHESEPIVKFGITGQDGQGRLRWHRWDGYTKCHMLVTALPSGAAKATEDAVRGALALAREKPVRGREYFDVSCLGLILDVAGPWLGAVAA